MKKRRENMNKRSNKKTKGSTQEEREEKIKPKIIMIKGRRCNIKKTADTLKGK